MSVALPEKTEMYSSEDLEKFYFDYLVEVTGAPEQQRSDSAMPSEVQEKQTDVSNEKVSVKVIISTSSGLEISRCGLDYPGLRSFINKLEGLLC